MERKLCPYTAEPLDSIKKVNDEHVLPVAIGAPMRFYVRAAEEHNSRLNDLIDSPFSNNSLVRFIAMSQGVKSRSGAITAKLDGIVTASGDQVVTGWNAEGLSLKFKEPVVTDDKGNVIAVRGYGDDAMNLALQIKRGMEKKGKPITLGEVESTTGAEVGFNLSLSNDQVFNELAKIAYLATVWIFGDAAIRSESGLIYRQALEMMQPDEWKAAGLQGGGSLPEGFDGKIASHQHQIICSKIGDLLVTSVNLFGIWAGFFCTPSIGISQEDGTGAAIKINVKTGSMTQTCPIETMKQNMVLLYGGIDEAARHIDETAEQILGQSQ